jgi:hypothetical protein
VTAAKHDRKCGGVLKHRNYESECCACQPKLQCVTCNLPALVMPRSLTMLACRSVLLCRAGEAGAVHKDYWLTDGLYGSFNCILYDDQKPQPLVSSRCWCTAVDWSLCSVLACWLLQEMHIV